MEWDCLRVGERSECEGRLVMTRQVDSKHRAPLPPLTALSAKYEHDWAEEITVKQAGLSRSKLSANNDIGTVVTIFHDNCQ